MQERTLGRTGVPVGVVGLGAWQLGADWGEVDEDQAMATLSAAHEAGVTFIDTADVYGDGRSERLVGRFVRSLPAAGPSGHGVTVATKMGRRVPQEAERYNLDNFRAWNDRSRENLGVDTIDLVQLHCPPSEVYSTDEVFDGLDLMVQEGRMKAYGVSVETAAEALTAIARPAVATVQIIFNMLRLKPLDDVLPAAEKMGVGIIARVPLASGLLSGRYDEHTTFGADDHRTYNRHGEAFDQGETFSGVDFATGLDAVRRLTPLRPESLSMTQFALRWIVDHPAVSVVIPGARNGEQARANAAAGDLPPLDSATHDAVKGIYDEVIRTSVHSRW